MATPSEEPATAPPPPSTAPPPAPRPSSVGATLFLGSLFGLWYLFNIYFNIYNKQVLKAFPRPLTITAFQFLVGGTVASAMWALGLHPRPSPAAALAASPLAAVHALGNALTNVSLGAVAVSFTHTIKALEPIFSVALSAAFLGERPTTLVVASLAPIVGGVALASAGELGFNWTGFAAAMGSNLTFQSRNVLSKRVLAGLGGRRNADGSAAVAPLDNVNLFSVITIASFFILAPIVLLLEGAPPLSADALRAAGIADPALFLRRSVLAALCFHAYQQVSYAILARVTPVSHAVGNCVKRVVVILASLVVFRNPLTAQSAAGTALALAGVFGYSSAKRASAKAAKAKKDT